MFWENFYNMCASKGTKPNPVAKEIGVSSGIVTKWKATGALPSGETLVKIADYLDCSVDYLLGRTDETYLKLTGPVTSTPASSELQRLSNALEELNEEGREKLLDYAADLVASGRYKKANPAGLGQKA